MESSRLTLIYRRRREAGEQEIQAADGINSLYLHSVNANELVVRCAPVIDAGQVLYVTFQKTNSQEDDDTPLNAILMQKREITASNSTHEVADNGSVTTLSDDFGGFEWATGIPQTVLDNGGTWQLSFDVREYTTGTTYVQIATSGVFPFNVATSIGGNRSIPTEFDIYNLFVGSERNKDAAAQSATAAATSATASATSATAAAESASEAAESASEAATSASNASVSATLSENAATTATQQAQNATTQAGNAAQSATEAAGYAEDAEDEKYAALASAAQAFASATQSGNSAQSSATSALQAEISAQRAEQAAEGIKPSFVVSIDDNQILNSTANSIVVTQPLVDINGRTVLIKDLTIGRNVYVIETDVPDRWVGEKTQNSATLYQLETTKVPVTDVRRNNESIVSGTIANFNVDSTPTNNSDNLVTSGGTYAMVKAEETAREQADSTLNAAIEDINDTLDSIDTQLDNIDGEISYESGRITQEVSDREYQDRVLEEMIIDVGEDVEAETQARIDADDVIDGNIATLSAGLQDAEQEIQELQNDIDIDVNYKSGQNLLSYNGDTVTITERYKNIQDGTTSTRTETVALANGTTAGLMAPSTVTAIQQMRAELDQLEGQSIRLVYAVKDNPTATEIGTFVVASGYTQSQFPTIGVVVKNTNHIWRWYNNTSAWQDIGVDTVNQFSNTVAGVIKGSTTDGQVYAEDDGTGSVNGWSALKNAVNGHIANTSNPHQVTKSQVGLGNVENERQYSATNPPPYPVSSVNSKTGAVSISKSDVGLGNVGNFKAVSTEASQGLTDAEKSNARANIGAGTSNGVDLITETQFSEMFR